MDYKNLQDTFLHFLNTYGEQGLTCAMQEYARMSDCGFVKCNRSCIVSLSKIQKIADHTIFLQNGDTLHVSRLCLSQVLSAFHEYLDAG